MNSSRKTKPALRSTTLVDLQSTLQRAGHPAFRAKQIYQWIFKHDVRSFDEMTNVPKEIRAFLEESYRWGGIESVEAERRASDGTVKFLFRLNDGNPVESVLMPDEDHYTLCISSQSGCPLKCTFCLTGLIGLKRSLDAAEIVDQVLYARRYLRLNSDRLPLRNLVFMGMGEPLLNVDEVVAALRILTRPEGCGFSPRRITANVGHIVIVEAVEGSGDRLVQDGITPLRWVKKWGTWRSVPERSSVENKIIEEVVRVTRATQMKYCAPVDLEWAYGRGLLTWLQMREITAIRDVPVYSNKLSKEFLPGLIKPLVWSVNVPLVNGAWIRLMTEAGGDLDLDPNTMARSFHFRAYFSLSAMRKFFDRFGLPEEMLEVLQGIEGVGSERPRFRMSPELLALFPDESNGCWKA